MRYLSVCSGIEAASVAWHPLGWTPVAFSEIDPFASALLEARFPDVPNLGNMENYREWPIESGAIDVLVGGTPCQSFSVAGLRKGLDDPRGNLALVYLGLVDRFRPRWVVWENVPGVLSSHGGRDFGAFLGGLAQLGYGWAYRIMDAQYVRVESHPRAVPQRRRRVFVVGCAGGAWRSAAEVLFEPEGVRGDPPTRRKAGQEAARGARAGAEGGGVADPVASKWAKGTGGPAGDEAYNLVPAIAGPLGGAAQSGGFRTTDLDNSGAFLVEPLPFDSVQVTSPTNRSSPCPGDPSSTLHSHAPAVAFPWPVQVADPITAHEGKTYTQEGKNNFRLHNVVPDAVIGFQSNLESQGGDVFYGVSPTVRIGSSGDNKGNPPAVAAPSLTASNDPSRSPQPSEITQQVAAVHASSIAVRRLTPRECERLQGFPDDWTLITYRGKPASDGPRYKALGNSMAVNVMRWLGARIALHG